jgi:hypothetical protein
LNDDQDERQNHHQHRLGRIADISEIAAQDIPLGTERLAEAVFKKAQLQKMGFYPVFDFLDSLLVGCPLENEQHQKSGEKRDEDHSDPGTHATKRQEQDVKYFAKS